MLSDKQPQCGYVHSPELGKQVIYTTQYTVPPLIVQSGPILTQLQYHFSWKIGHTLQR